MRKVLVPVDASVGSAVGFLRAPVAFEIARSLPLRDDCFDVSQVNTSCSNSMQSEATAIVAAGALGAKLATRRAVEMRYLGQGHEISVPLPARRLTAADAKKLRAELREALRSAVRPADRGRAGGVPDLVGRTFQRSRRSNGESKKAKAGNSKATAERQTSVFDPVRGKLEKIPSYRRSGTRARRPARGPGAGGRAADHDAGAARLALPRHAARATLFSRHLK